ncbi:helix-turn-helix domain-containing protein [Vibrio navarrensis]
MARVVRNRERRRKIALTEQIGEPGQQQIITKGNSANTVLVEGQFLNYRYADAIALQGSISTELKESEIVSTAQPCLNLVFLLSGKVKFGFDNREFELCAAEQPKAIVINLAQPTTFRRTLLANNQIKKLNIAIHPDWLKHRLSGDEPIAHFLSHHLACCELPFAESMAKAISAILALPVCGSLQQKLQLECQSHLLIAQCLNLLNEQNFERSSSEPNHDYHQIEQILAYIDANLHQPLDLTHLAKRFSMSVSNLQRHFKQALNLTISGYIRHRRLNIAKIQLERGLISVTEAAYEAGYHHPSNFTNAFKRTFGITPNEIAQKPLLSTIKGNSAA